MADSVNRSSERSTSSSERGAPKVGAEEASAVGCLLRLIWMVLGNIALLALVGLIAQRPSWSFTWRDAAFWLMVFGLIAIRYIDVARFEGATVNGEPASLRHVRRHALGVAGVALVLWLIAQSMHR